jgi:hypothetical protein
MESLIGRIINESFSDFWCIQIKSVGFKAEKITQQIYEVLRLPITTVTSKECKGHVIISDNEMAVLEQVCNMNPSSENRLVILVLNVVNQILDHSDVFDDADVILASSGKIHRLTMSKNSRYFEEVTGGSKLLPVKTSSLPDFMGRTLQAGTFFCPPFSFGTAGNLSSATAEATADGECLAVLLSHY